MNHFRDTVEIRVTENQLYKILLCNKVFQKISLTTVLNQKQQEAHNKTYQTSLKKNICRRKMNILYLGDEYFFPTKIFRNEAPPLPPFKVFLYQNTSTVNIRLVSSHSTVKYTILLILNTYT